MELLRILLSSVTNESLALDRFFKTNKKCIILAIIYFIYFPVANSKMYKSTTANCLRKLPETNIGKDSHCNNHKSRFPHLFSPFLPTIAEEGVWGGGMEDHCWSKTRRECWNILEKRESSLLCFVFGSKWISGSHPLMRLTRQELSLMGIHLSLRWDTVLKSSPQWVLLPP